VAFVQCLFWFDWPAITVITGQRNPEIGGPIITGIGNYNLPEYIR